MAGTGELIRLRYPASCSSCGSDLPRGSLAQWDRVAKTATCESCVAGGEITAQPVVEINRGEVGGSAAREWHRRHERRETRVRSEHKHLAGLLLALSPDSQSTTAWATGAGGEQTIGESLDRLRDDGIAVLHDRRIPGLRANIDHIVISRAGVFVIDTKHYKRQQVHGGLRRGVPVRGNPDSPNTGTRATRERVRGALNRQHPP